MLWEIDVYPAPGQTDLLARQVAAAASELGVAPGMEVTTAGGYLIHGNLQREQVERLALQLFADPIIERFVVGSVGEEALNRPPRPGATLIHVMPKPRVMDPAAASATAAIGKLGFSVTVRLLRKFWLSNISPAQAKTLAIKLLTHAEIEQVIIGPLTLERLDEETQYRFQLNKLPLGTPVDGTLEKWNDDHQLALSAEELQSIRRHFLGEGRDPIDAELETLAQNWSEHCSHKTLTGRIAYRGPMGAHGDRIEQHYFENLLEETIFAATRRIREVWRKQGQEDWCASVFEDHAGIVRFDDQHHLAIKVETHNHPSAVSPYGGASTGIGGVVRDILAAGLAPSRSRRPTCSALPRWIYRSTIFLQACCIRAA